MTGMRLHIATLLAPALLLTGCRAPVAPTTPTSMRVTVQTPEEMESLWTAANTTLRRHYLEPDRQDRIDGVIVSKPETTGVWFEWWRPQPKPAYAWWEANLQPVRRQATINIKPVARPEYELSVEVDRYKYSLEERQIDNPAAALRLYSAEAPTQAGRMERPSQTARWLPEGRDGEMEQAILSGILRRYVGAASTPPAEPAATRPEAG
jgi:hypothetical protein